MASKREIGWRAVRESEDDLRIPQPMSAAVLIDNSEARADIEAGFDQLTRLHAGEVIESAIPSETPHSANALGRLSRSALETVLGAQVKVAEKIGIDTTGIEIS